MMEFEVLLYYWFTALPDYEELSFRHLAICKTLGIRGRVLLAPEGINGTISGTRVSCKVYREILLQDPRFQGIEFKSEPSQGHAFKRLTVKAREEIISLGELVNPLRITGVHLSPSEWREMMKRDDVAILDGRNQYESQLGRFANAITPDLQNFRDFPAWIRANHQLFEGKHVLTYCTGGIRCEKLSAWMITEGFENVYQLHGGIVRYGQDPETLGEGFEGVNVVFDDRVVTEVGPKASPLITRCEKCDRPSANFVNCADVDCNRRMILCPECEVASERSCSESCRQASRRREKNAKFRA